MGYSFVKVGRLSGCHQNIKDKGNTRKSNRQILAEKINLSTAIFMLGLVSQMAVTDLKAANDGPETTVGYDFSRSPVQPTEINSGTPQGVDPQRQEPTAVKRIQDRSIPSTGAKTVAGVDDTRYGGSNTPATTTIPGADAGRFNTGNLQKASQTEAQSSGSIAGADNNRIRPTAVSIRLENAVLVVEYPAGTALEFSPALGEPWQSVDPDGDGIHMTEANSLGFFRAVK